MSGSAGELLSAHETNMNMNMACFSFLFKRNPQHLVVRCRMLEWAEPIRARERRGDMTIPREEVRKSICWPSAHAWVAGRSYMSTVRNVDPTTNTPSEILLEALQNFVIRTAGGKNKEGKSPLCSKHNFDHLFNNDISDTDQVHSMGPEAGKLLAALQEFISSMIVQSQVGQTQRIEVDLDGKPLPRQYHGL
jgi:hypothetical protein